MQAEIIAGDEIGARLRFDRKDRGLTQADFAAIGGVSLNTQHRYEAGAIPSTDYLLKLGEAGVDWVWVMTGRRLDTALDVVTSELVTLFESMPDDFQEATLTYLRATAAAIERMGLGQPRPTINDRRAGFRSEADT